MNMKKKKRLTKSVDGDKGLRETEDVHEHKDGLIKSGVTFEVVMSGVRQQEKTV